MLSKKKQWNGNRIKNAMEWYQNRKIQRKQTIKRYDVKNSPKQ